MGTGAAFKTNPVAAIRFDQPNAYAMSKPGMPQQARNFTPQMSMKPQQARNFTPQMSMKPQQNFANASAQFQKLGNAVNQTFDNAAYNLNSILNGQSQNPYLATSAGPMMMQSSNMQGFQNVGSNQTQAKATPVMNSTLNAVSALTAKKSSASRRSTTVMMAGPTVSGQTGGAVNDSHFD